MNPRCLNYCELEEILSCLISGDEPNEDYCKSLYDCAREWETELVGLSYLFLYLVTKKARVPSSLDSLLSVFYTCESELYFDIESCGEEFIEFILKHERCEGEELKDQLVVLCDGFKNHDYSQALCV